MKKITDRAELTSENKNVLNVFRRLVDFSQNFLQCNTYRTAANSSLNAS
jgi:hypothetical protein